MPAFFTTSTHFVILPSCAASCNCCKARKAAIFGYRTATDELIKIKVGSIVNARYYKSNPLYPFANITGK